MADDALRFLDIWIEGKPPDPGRSDGKPERFICKDCDWTGRGYLQRAEHWRVTNGHRTAWRGKGNR